MKILAEDKKILKRPVLLITYALVLGFALWKFEYWGMAYGMVMGTLFPFIIGAAMAFVVNIPMSYIENLKSIRKVFKNKSLRRVFSLVVSYLLVIVVIALIVGTVIPQLVTSLYSIVDQLPSLGKKLQSLSVLQHYSAAVTSYLTQIKQVAMQYVNNFITSGSSMSLIGEVLFSVSLVFSTFFSMIVGVIFSIYILSSKEKLSRDFKTLTYSLLSENLGDKIVYFCSVLYRHFYNYFTGQFVDSMLLGVMCFVAMSLFGFPYPLVISLFIALSSLIPMVGAFMGMLVGTVIILMESPTKALLFIVLILVLQQIDDNFMYPRIVGKAVGLPTIWVLVAVTLGASLMGVVGMVCFVPIFSTFYDLTKIYTAKKIADKQIDVDSKVYANLSGQIKQELLETVEIIEELDPQEPQAIQGKSTHSN